MEVSAKAMDGQQQHDISALLDRVKSILATQNLPGQTSSASSPSTSSPPVIPKCIVSLDTQARLPSGSKIAAAGGDLNKHNDSSLTNLTDVLMKRVLPNLNNSSLSPNYYGLITGGATPAALLSDFLVSIYDQNCSIHLPSETISTEIEVAALNLLVDLFGLPRKDWGVGIRGCRGGGTITTGATASNVLGLAMGREWIICEALRRRQREQSQTSGTHDRHSGHSDVNGKDNHAGVATTGVGDDGLLSACASAGISRIQVISSLPHSSIVKAASIVGIGRNNVVSVSRADDALSTDVDKVERLASTMRAEGKAYILAVSSGEVNTGRFVTDGIESMTRLRRICDEHGIWIHVDGAFGLFGRVLADSTNPQEYRAVISGSEGLELADSITSDGHKLLNVPYECGLFFTRHKEISEMVFQNSNAAYLASGTASDNDGSVPAVQSPMNVGIENSRRFRALPVWATLTAYGRRGYVDMLERQIALAREVARWMWTVDELELLPRCKSVEEVVEKTFMIVLFRAKDPNVNRELVKRINATGRMYVTGTKWEGEQAARIAVSNWQADVERDSALIKDVLSRCLT